MTNTATAVRMAPCLPLVSNEVTMFIKTQSHPMAVQEKLTEIAGKYRWRIRSVLDVSLVLLAACFVVEVVYIFVHQW